MAICYLEEASTCCCFRDLLPRAPIITFFRANCALPASLVAKDQRPSGAAPLLRRHDLGVDWRIVTRSFWRSSTACWRTFSGSSSFPNTLFGDARAVEKFIWSAVVGSPGRGGQARSARRLRSRRGAPLASVPEPWLLDGALLFAWL